MKHRIYALCVIKNEEDIIRFTLTKASNFCEKIFVLDNGSTDNTWEIVNDISKINPIIVPFERKVCQFGEWLRGYVFNNVRETFRDGDWVWLLDSDEILEENPRKLIEWCETNSHDIIKFFKAQFYITDLDVEQEWFLKPEKEIMGFGQLPTYYKIDWKDPRMFRYKQSLDWPLVDNLGKPNQKFLPFGIYRSSPRGLLCRHYQYRSYKQIENRITLRSKLLEETGLFPHSKAKSVSSYIRSHLLLKSVECGEKIRYSLLDRSFLEIRMGLFDLNYRIKRLKGSE